MKSQSFSCGESSCTSDRAETDEDDHQQHWKNRKKRFWKRRPNTNLANEQAKQVMGSIVEAATMHTTDQPEHDIYQKLARVILLLADLPEPLRSTVMSQRTWSRPKSSQDLFIDPLETADHLVNADNIEREEPKEMLDTNKEDVKNEEMNDEQDGFRENTDPVDIDLTSSDGEESFTIDSSSSVVVQNKSSITGERQIDPDLSMAEEDSETDSIADVFCKLDMLKWPSESGEDGVLRLTESSTEAETTDEFEEVPTPPLPFRSAESEGFEELKVVAERMKKCRAELNEHLMGVGNKRLAIDMVLRTNHESKDRAPVSKKRDKTVPCEICDKKYASEPLLQMHIRRVHMEENNWECQLCNYKGFAKSELIYHTRDKHTFNHPHRCAVCHKGFNRKYELKKHSTSFPDGKCIKTILKDSDSLRKTGKLCMDLCGDEFLSAKSSLDAANMATADNKDVTELLANGTSDDTEMSNRENLDSPDVLANGSMEDTEVLSNENEDAQQVFGDQSTDATEVAVVNSPSISQVLAGDSVNGASQPLLSAAANGVLPDPFVNAICKTEDNISAKKSPNEIVAVEVAQKSIKAKRNKRECHPDECSPAKKTKKTGSDKHSSQSHHLEKNLKKKSEQKPRNLKSSDVRDRDTNASSSKHTKDCSDKENEPKHRPKCDSSKKSKKKKRRSRTTTYVKEYKLMAVSIDLNKDSSQLLLDNKDPRSSSYLKNKTKTAGKVGKRCISIPLHRKDLEPPLLSITDSNLSQDCLDEEVLYTSLLPEAEREENKVEKLLSIVPKEEKGSTVEPMVKEANDSLTLQKSVVTEGVEQCLKVKMAEQGNYCASSNGENSNVPARTDSCSEENFAVVKRENFGTERLAEQSGTPEQPHVLEDKPMNVAKLFQRPHAGGELVGKKIPSIKDAKFSALQENYFHHQLRLSHKNGDGLLIYEVPPMLFIDVEPPPFTSIDRRGYDCERRERRQHRGVLNREYYHKDYPSVKSYRGYESTHQRFEPNRGYREKQTRHTCYTCYARFSDKRALWDHRNAAHPETIRSNRRRTNRGDTRERSWHRERTG